MRFVSLFAGVGGFDLAFESAGMDCVGQVEINTKCREVLAKHWPEVPRWEDVYEVSGLDDLGSVDVICGGFPCQDYSMAGLRNGLAGDRGALWWQFHRLIAESRPRWVVGENVPGLLSSNDGRDFRTIIGSLVELGYGVVWRVLDAQYFGVAQQRRRVFIVGHSGGIPRPETLDLAQGCAWDSPPRRGDRATLSSTAADSTGVGGKELMPVTLSEDHPTWDWHMEDSLVAFIPAVASTLRASVGVKVHANGQLISDGMSVRLFTPLEFERLQGFPDGWTAGQSDTQRYKQMGNAVAVPVAEWIGKQLAKAGP